LASEPISDVAILAVLVARANVQRQLQAAAREAWMREFREQVAQFLASLNAEPRQRELAPGCDHPAVDPEPAGQRYAE
jgi:hypothetical protein